MYMYCIFSLLEYCCFREEYLRILGEAKEKIRQGAKEMTADENKQSFIKWFEVFDGRKCTVELFLDHFEKVSSYAKKYNISLDWLFGISQRTTTISSLSDVLDFIFLILFMISPIVLLMIVSYFCK